MKNIESQKNVISWSGPQPEYIECNAGNSHDILR